jgi:hypothetical protein
MAGFAAGVGRAIAAGEEEIKHRVLCPQFHQHRPSSGSTRGDGGIIALGLDEIVQTIKFQH